MYTAETLDAWQGNDYRRWLALSVARASYGVYLILKKNYQFPYQWANGVERGELETNMMYEALVKQAEKHGNPLAFAQMIAGSLPEGELYRDNNIINRVETLIRNNP